MATSGARASAHRGVAVRASQREEPCIAEFTGLFGSDRGGPQLINSRPATSLQEARELREEATPTQSPKRDLEVLVREGVQGREPEAENAPRKLVLLESKSPGE